MYRTNTGGNLSMSCCTNTLNLGCFRFVDAVTVIDSIADDTYTLTFESGVTNHVITYTLTGGPGPLTYTDAGVLQPGYTYVVNVTDSNGDAVTDTVDAVVYNCWKFTYKTETV